ncbi:acyltransferase family protein [Neisseria sp. Ec49-e6-T10]|uniref:acyltransferase family protein n=1 Tax=Neisseria sp. Ec49-e6-T10 TaxID=3140744 RepID=UPI003EBB1D3E
MKLNSLTSLRFFAAFFVFLHHFHLQSFYINFQNKNESLEILYKYMHEGFIGVTFFFILSGFVITYSSHQSMLKGEYKSGKFLYNRFARLYPVHLLTLLIAIVAYKYMYAFSFNPSNIKALIANIFLVQSWIPDPNYFWSYNGVSWSLSCELFFYISFTLFVLLNNKQLFTVYAAILITIIISLIYIEPLEGFAWIFYINPTFRIVDFISGIFLCRLFLSEKIHIPQKYATIFEVLSIFLLFVFIVYGVNNLNYDLRGGIYYIAPMSFIVFIFAYGKGVLSKLICLKPFVILGEASFSLYMIHQIIINISYKYFVEYLDANRLENVIFFVSVVLIFTLTASYVMYKFYEKPLNNFLRKANPF